MDGVIKVPDVLDGLKGMLKHGLPKGVSTGWDSISELYRPELGYFTIITGIPGHGKSEWLDALLINLAAFHKWKFLFFSPENFPVEMHIVKLFEKYCDKPYWRLEKDKVTFDACYEWVDEYFGFLNPPEDKINLDSLLETAKQYQGTYGLQGFVLDPWNEIEHIRPAHLSETEYISQSLTKIRRFCRKNKVHVWVVAHPTKLKKNVDGIYDPPTPYDISGSAAWRNKADFCITVHRPDFNKQGATIIVNKVKFKSFGKTGNCDLTYDYSTGRFSDDNPPKSHYGARYGD